MASILSGAGQRDFRQTRSLSSGLLASLSEVKQRPELVFFLLVGLLSLTVSIAFSWWQLMEGKEPLYFAAFRVIEFGCLAFIAFSIAVRRMRVPAVLTAGLLAITLPFVGLLIVCTLDARSMSHVVTETMSADYLLKGITFSDRNPQIPWSSIDHVQTYAIKRNDYTFVDGVEFASVFVKLGWYASLFAGCCLLGVGWSANIEEASKFTRRSAPRLAAGTAVLLLVSFGHLFISYLYLHAARAAEARANYTAALADYQRAEFWDPRLNFDLAFHFDLGRVYTFMGLASEPDYWVVKGDEALQGQMYQDAYSVYHDNGVDVTANPALRMRYVTTLLNVAMFESDQKQYDLASAHLLQAAALQPDNVEVEYYLGETYARIGDYPSAIHWWKVVINNCDGVNLYRYKYLLSHIYLSPIIARAWNGTAYCYFQEHEYDRAATARVNAQELGRSIPNFGDDEDGSS